MGDLDWAREEDTRLCFAGDDAACRRVWWTYYGFPTLLEELRKVGLQFPPLQHPLTRERLWEGSAGGIAGGVPSTPELAFDPRLQGALLALIRQLGVIDPPPARLSATTFASLLQADQAKNSRLAKAQQAVTAQICEAITSVVSSMQQRMLSGDAEPAKPDQQTAPVELDRILSGLSVLREAAEESERRTPSFRNIKILEYQENDTSGEDVLVPGTLTLLLARQGSEMFKRAVASLNNEGRFDGEIIKRIKETYAARKKIGLPEAVELLKSQATIADLVGGRFTLASNLFVPKDMDLALVPMPYNGGDLKEVAFSLVQHHAAQQETEDLEAVLVRRPPALSQIEREALALVPRDALDLNVGRTALCYAVTAVTIVAVVIAATSVCPGRPIDVHLDDDVISRLGPQLTARTLVRLRRQALERRI